MRKFFLLLCFLCLHYMAQGQAVYQYRYWFDNDDSRIYTGTSATEKWHLDIDLSALSYSFHSIHIQVMDQQGIWSSPHTRFFVKHPYSYFDQLYYWFDEDSKGKQQLASTSGHFNLDVSSLSEQMHYLYFQVFGEKTEMSSPRAVYFLKSPHRGDLSFHYWVDGDSFTHKSGKFSNGITIIDVSDFSDGFHTLFMQVEKNETHSSTIPESRMFIKIPQTDNVDYITCVCMVDGEMYHQEKVSSKGGNIDWNFDVSSLSQGVHHAQIQILTPSGAGSSTRDAFFIRTAMTEEIENMKLYYSIDKEDFSCQAGSFNNGIFYFELDVNHLNDGEHSISYMLMDDKGNSTRISSTYFIKGEIDETGIEKVTSGQKGINVFDLQGRKMRKTGKGIYIIDGEKVIIR